MILASVFAGFLLAVVPAAVPTPPPGPTPAEVAQTPRLQCRPMVMEALATMFMQGAVFVREEKGTDFVLFEMTLDHVQLSAGIVTTENRQTISEAGFSLRAECVSDDGVLSLFVTHAAPKKPDTAPLSPKSKTDGGVK